MLGVGYVGFFTKKKYFEMKKKIFFFFFKNYICIFTSKTLQTLHPIHLKL
jgi:hypothetical protein